MLEFYFSSLVNSTLEPTDHFSLLYPLVEAATDAPAIVVVPDFV